MMRVADFGPPRAGHARLRTLGGRCAGWLELDTTTLQFRPASGDPAANATLLLRLPSIDSVEVRRSIWQRAAPGQSGLLVLTLSDDRQFVFAVRHVWHWTQAIHNARVGRG